MTLRDKVVVITGASGGLGEILAKKIAQEEARVVLIARSTKKLQTIVSDLQQMKYKVSFFSCDIQDLMQVRKTVDAILAQEKAIDILINNAGIWTDNEIDAVHPQKRQEAFDTNCVGTIQLTNEILTHMKEKNSGYIFTVISTSGTADSSASDNAYWHTYGATKWALTGFTNALRSELAKTHIKVTGFFPGGIDTNLYENAGKKDMHAQPWMMKPEDIADIVVFALTRPEDVLLEKIVVTKVF